jgi:pyruvate,water dikinase
MEWTIHNQRLTVLQARPVTTLVAGDDQRAWYLSLTRSVDNLQELRRRIESEFLPAMDQDAERLANRDLGLLDDQELAEEIDRRKAMHDHWVDIYWREFIPFAHGVRLFGQFYNELVRPVDPFEFMDLLTSTPMLSVQRNRVLEALADHLRDNPALVAGDSGDAEFETDVRSFIERFGNTAFGDERPFADRKRVLKIIAQLAGRPPVRTVEPISRESFLARIDQRSRETASDLLELARASYRLRDDDNIHLAAIKAEVLRAAGEGRSRLGSNADALDIDRIIHSLRNPNTVVEPSPRASEPQAEPGFELRPRQLVGQPAGPGVALGPARVLAKPDDLFDFVDGEVLVCDAVEPNMTFVVPLAAAVVERRGGMLIHGAIIAREYGLPCVTGVQHVTKLVRTGDRLTVDGYLGIVTVGTHERDTEIS